MKITVNYKMPMRDVEVEIPEKWIPYFEAKDTPLAYRTPEQNELLMDYDLDFVLAEILLDEVEDAEITDVWED